mmetsp:Transcript_23760/g.70532  ORF Transcript_23760/g.70532 Transcript_23760/m.70532 type:complete len:221 (-) Transcript_23760:912-1574(-)
MRPSPAASGRCAPLPGRRLALPSRTGAAKVPFAPVAAETRASLPTRPDTAHRGARGAADPLACRSTRPGESGEAHAVPSLSQAFVPRSIYDVDNGLVLGFGADLANDHPGYHDEAYKQRRAVLSQAAKKHVIGTPIPPVEYSLEECGTWASVLRELQPLLQRHACKEYLHALPLLAFVEDEVGRTLKTGLHHHLRQMCQLLPKACAPCIRLLRLNHDNLL